jgi:hypothetical protein
LVDANELGVVVDLVEGIDEVDLPDPAAQRGRVGACAGRRKQTC